MRAKCPQCDYPLDEGRSRESHNHYFARLQRAFDQLPEAFVRAHKIIDKHDMRAWALTEAGHVKRDVHLKASRKEADAFAEGLTATKRMREQWPPRTVISVKGAVVIIQTPKSQKEDFMNGKQFNKSKQDVLEVLANVIGISVDDLARQYA